jgi:hypothetical protein
MMASWHPLFIPPSKYRNIDMPPRYPSLDYLKAKTDDTEAEQEQRLKEWVKSLSAGNLQESQLGVLTDHGLTSGQTHIC